MKRFFIWQYMLNKRLLHKKEFIILLCLIPLLVWGITLVSKEESSVVTVALSMEDEEDELANQIIDEMMQEDSIIRFIFMEPEASYEAVRAGEVDCAWIFREDFQKKLITTFAKRVEEVPPVYVVVQEDNVALKLSRTKLYGYIFPHLAFLLGQNFLETEVMDGQAVSAEELQRYFDENAVEQGIIQIAYLSKDEILADVDVTDREEEAPVSYLMTPIRGMLLVLLIVAGLVVTLYYMQDEERGMFAWIPVHKRRGLFYSYLFGALLDTGLVVLLGFFISDGKLVSLREIGILLLYIPATATFCELVKILIRRKERLAKWIPLLAVAMLGICPVFLDLGTGFAVQYAFPATYYLRGLYDKNMIWYMLLYAVVLFAAGGIYHKIADHRKILE